MAGQTGIRINSPCPYRQLRAQSHRRSGLSFVRCPARRRDGWTGGKQPVATPAAAPSPTRPRAVWRRQEQGRGARRQYTARRLACGWKCKCTYCGIDPTSSDARGKRGGKRTGRLATGPWQGFYAWVAGLLGCGHSHRRVVASPLSSALWEPPSKQAPSIYGSLFCRPPVAHMPRRHGSIRPRKCPCNNAFCGVEPAAMGTMSHTP